MPNERTEKVQVHDRPSVLDERRISVEGEMADRIRRFAWGTSPVGPISGWSETLLRALNLMLEMQFPAVLLWGPEMAVFYNDAYLPLMTERHPQALGKPARDCWPEAWHIIGPQFEAVMEHGKKFYFENVLVPILRQGSLCDVYWTCSYSPVRGPGSAIDGALILCHDVTARLAAERERDATAASLKNVLESTTDGLVVLDKQWRYTYINAQGARMIGVRPEDLLGKSLWESFPHAVDSEFGHEFRRAVETRKPGHVTAFYPEPLNAWLECHSYPSQHGLSVYFRDVTEQRQTEIALRASESRFRKLFESDLMGIGIPDRFGAFRESNDELLRMTGYTRADQEAGLVRWDAMTPPEYADLDIAHIREAAERGSCTPYQKEYIRKDGNRVPILCGYALLEGSQDEYIGFVLDLSEQKRAERELREREERFRVLAESLPEFVWMRDGDGDYVYCNQRLLDYVGQPTQWLRTNAFEAVHPDDRAGTIEKWKRSLETGEIYLNEYRLRRHDGTYRYFLARAVPVRDETGRVQRWLGSSTDVHDQKLAEEAIRRSEKLATAGRLAASMAHEINNPLNAVVNTIYLALKDEELSESTRSLLESADLELARVGQYVTQTLRFHKQSTAPSDADLGEIMDSVLAMYAPRFRSASIRLQKQYRTQEKLRCFSSELRQVFANLVGNALDATGEKGLIQVRVRAARSWTEPVIRGIRVLIADTGAGIPPELRAQLFEPFVSTKESTGVGLGLWVSQGLVHKHNGRISLRTRTHPTRHGTLFSIFFPFL